MNSVADKSQAQSEFEGRRSAPSPGGDLLWLLLIFALGFSVRYWYNFLFPHISDYEAGDAYEYLRNAGALMSLRQLPPDFWSQAGQVLMGLATPQTIAHVKQVLAPLNDLAISGAVFPVYLAACYVLSGMPFNIGSWMPPVFGQCVISALIGVFMFLTAKYAYNRRTGVLAGIFCALYPGFIINSERLYTETFATFLLSVICFLTIQGFARRRSRPGGVAAAFVSGLVAAGLEFTRSIMVVLTVALIPITIMQQGWRRGLPAVGAFLAAFALIALPWLAFQKLAFGAASLVLDRAGHYNFYTGNCVDTHGWLTFPYPNMAGIEAKSLPRLAVESYRRGPYRWLRLMQDKPLRLFKFPWNDFRKPIGLISFHWQVLIHQALLLLAVIGIVLGWVTGQEQPDSSRKRFRSTFFLLSVLSLQFVYLFFITIPRYNLTAMPLVLLFAGVGVNSLVQLARSRNGLMASSCVTAAAVFLYLIVRRSPMPWLAAVAGGKCVGLGMVLQAFGHLLSVGLLGFCLWHAISRLSAQRPRAGATGPGKLLSRVALGCFAVVSLPVLILPAGANGRFGEWQAQIAQGQTIRQEIDLPSDSAALSGQRQVYLLIDAASGVPLQSAAVKVNGTVVDAPLVPSISLVDDFTHFQNLPEGFLRDSEWIFSCLTGRSGISNVDLRQWFVMPIPYNLIAGRPEVRVEITNQGNLYKPTVFGSYDTGKKYLEIPSLSLYSWEKAFYGVENDKGFSDTRFNIKIPGQPSQVYNLDLSGDHGIQSGRYNIHLLAGPPRDHKKDKGSMAMDSPYMVELARVPLGTMTIDDRSPEVNWSIKDIPPYGERDWWLVRIKGMARRQSGAGELAVQLKTRLVAPDGSAAAATSLTRNWGDVAATRPDPTKPYVSPWTGNTRLSPEWQRIDMTVPIVPGSFGAPVKDISWSLSAPTNPALGAATSGRSTGTTELSDLTVQIMRLPNGPLGTGYEIY